jgi:hypothetical protein
MGWGDELVKRTDFVEETRISHLSRAQTTSKALWPVDRSCISIRKLSLTFSVDLDRSRQNIRKKQPFERRSTGSNAVCSKEVVVGRQRTKSMR